MTFWWFAGTADCFAMQSLGLAGVGKPPFAAWFQG
jgi:predicted secreted hydrolase